MIHLAPEQAKADTAGPLGLYVHVPFCASTCDFCAFYQTEPTAARGSDHANVMRSGSTLLTFVI